MESAAFGDALGCSNRVGAAIVELVHAADDALALGARPVAAAGSEHRHFPAAVDLLECDRVRARDRDVGVSAVDADTGNARVAQLVALLVVEHVVQLLDRVRARARVCDRRQVPLRPLCDVAARFLAVAVGGRLQVGARRGLQLLAVRTGPRLVVGPAARERRLEPMPATSAP
jgi:hypothetical protein